jgi:hypothetical protein
MHRPSPRTAPCHQKTTSDVLHRPAALHEREEHRQVKGACHPKQNLELFVLSLCSFPFFCVSFLHRLGAGDNMPTCSPQKYLLLRFLILPPRVVQ